jgi:Protein of unknown function (DUF1376)
MKWYKHDPHRFLEGVAELTMEERGAYITIIDLLYARAPLSNVTDKLILAAVKIDPRTWRRLKASLMAKGKIHETPTGLMANGVISELTSAQDRMKVTREMRVQLLHNQALKLNGNRRTTTIR